MTEPKDTLPCGCEMTLKLNRKAEFQFCSDAHVEQAWLWLVEHLAEQHVRESNDPNQLRILK